MGDKAHLSTAIRKNFRDRGIQQVNPEPADQIANRKRRGSKGGRPPSLDREIYTRRTVAERSFGGIKQWREISTRYDNLAITHRGGVVLRAIIIWLEALPDSPKVLSGGQRCCRAGRTRPGSGLHQVKVSVFETAISVATTPLMTPPIYGLPVAR